jgi:nitrate/nitrite transporter NarK
MPLIVLLIVAALVVDFFWLLAAVMVTVVVARLIGCWLAQRDDRSIAERQRMAELSARADQQHAWVLAGDDCGVYGNWPPVAT